MQPKVIISTDIGGNDKDDAQSFIHALLYADKVDYKGFIATSSDVGGVDGISPMNKIINAYAQDLPNLREAGDYPGAGELRDLVTQGATNGSWPGGLSDGARLIIEEARKADPDDPLYLLAWGPVHDIARALREAPDIVDNVRVCTIFGYGQDSRNPAAFNWMKNAIANDSRYEDLFWIDAAETFRGMYVTSSGSNNPGANLGWVRENVDGHGALGELYYSDYTFDLYGGSSPDGLKMGDTPSLLYLLDSVNNDNPGAYSWGGSFRKAGIGNNHWVDKSGEALGNYDGARTVYQHRDAVWSDFARLLDVARDGVPGNNNGPSLPPEPDPDDQGPAPAPAPAPDPAPIPPATDDNPGDDTMLGSGQADDFHGGTGDDTLAGRGGNDRLDGGADNDRLNAGAGNDLLIYNMAENRDATDLYVGSSGYDTLRIEVTQDVASSGTFQSHLQALQRFISNNYDTGEFGGPSFQLGGTGLTVRRIENVEVRVVDGASAPDPTPVEPPAPDDGPAPSPDPVPTPDPDPTPAPTPIDTPDDGALPIFRTTGSRWDDEMKGGSAFDSFDGAAGNDLLLGRGGNDVLKGGAGSDYVKGGVGNDRLIYVAAENGGARDVYQGSRGVDTLALFVEEDLFNSAAFQEDIIAFEAFAAANRDTSRDGGDAFAFDSIGLRVQSTEELEVYLYDLG